jgi:hypothetical protein
MGRFFQDIIQISCELAIPSLSACPAGVRQKDNSEPTFKGNRTEKLENSELVTSTETELNIGFCVHFLYENRFILPRSRNLKYCAVSRLIAGHSGLRYEMSSPARNRDRRFESHSRHGCLCSFCLYK